MTQQFRNVRRHPRVPVRVPVRVSTIDPETDPRTGRSCFRATRELCANLSRGGAFIHTDDPLSPGHRVLVEIHVPGSDPIETLGRVAWAKSVLGPGGRVENGVGVEFVDASASGLDGEIERFLTRPDPGEG